MDSISPEGRDTARQRRRLTTDVREAMREVSVQLMLLNHRVSSRLDMKDVDLDCLDLISRYGPLSPSVLAKRAGLHPATLTGVLDRLERGGWIARDRDPADRRAVVVRGLRERAAEIMGLYAGMNSSLEEICGGYDEAQLQTLADFLRRTADAGRKATDDLTVD